MQIDWFPFWKRPPPFTSSLRCRMASHASSTGSPEDETIVPHHSSCQDQFQLYIQIVLRLQDQGSQSMPPCRSFSQTAARSVLSDSFGFATRECLLDVHNCHWRCYCHRRR